MRRSLSITRLRTRSIAKYTTQSTSVDWDSYLTQVGEYNGHEEH